ncbi:hypothetical protein CONLIGDRAFT_628349 [Coniochaeta ligniaria NRRL 30616]|uniref:Uncharacterized protein n=1 Tax=Coniochaeta ligniaria NRRL 30616 TaxID=1408157 RepID=A0A1J7J1U7_9PEZI|nr:hypothetical protein CONLIGDRAFT_628349 [Coniochaeta ligniaria NRRL 30616]
MPSLSRGLCARVLSFSSRPISHTIMQPLPARLACRSHVPISQHLFSTFRSLQASARPPTSKPSPPLAKPKPAPKPIPSTTTRAPPPSPAYAALLASKSTPTLLYEAPNQFWFTFSAFNAGAFCLSYVAVQYYTIFLNTPQGLAWWVPHGYAVICGFMAVIGFYWMRWPSRIVRSLSAVPIAPAKGGNGSPAGLQLEIATKRWVPFLPLKKTRYNLEEVHVPAPVASLVYAASGKAGLERLSPAEQLRLARIEEERKAKARQYEIDHIMTAPFRHFARGVKAAVRGMARALTREGFAKIRVKKSELKLDVKGGWFLDEGKALDRLIHAKPDGK